MSLQSCQSLIPTLSEGQGEALNLESKLQDLPLHRFEIELGYLGSQLAQVFEHHPFLPGAILVNQGNYVGMLSRRRLLEYLIRPHGLDIFWQSRFKFSTAMLDVISCCCRGLRRFWLRLSKLCGDRLAVE